MCGQQLKQKGDRIDEGVSYSKEGLELNDETRPDTQKATGSEELLVVVRGYQPGSGRLDKTTDKFKENR